MRELDRFAIPGGRWYVARGHTQTQQALSNRANTMLKARWIPFSALFLLLTACPYSGPAKLGMPDAALFDPQLIGEWVPSSGDFMTDVMRTVTLMRLDNDEYAVAGYEWCPAGGRGHLTRVGDALFLNVRNVRDNKFKIARVIFEGEALRLRFLSDRLSRHVTDSALRNHVAPRLQDSTIYDNAGVPAHRSAKVMTATGDSALRQLTMGCSLDDAARLGEPEAGPMLDRLKGVWRFAMPDSNNMTLDISRFNQTELLTTWIVEDDDDFLNRSYLTTIAGATFMVSHDLPFTGSDSYQIARLQFAGDTLVMRSLSSELGEVSDKPAEFLAAITARVNDPLIYYHAAYRFVRVR